MVEINDVSRLEMLSLEDKQIVLRFQARINGSIIALQEGGNTTKRRNSMEAQTVVNGEKGFTH